MKKRGSGRSFLVKLFNVTDRSSLSMTATLRTSCLFSVGGQLSRNVAADQIPKKERDSGQRRLAVDWAGDSDRLVVFASELGHRFDETSLAGRYRRAGIAHLVDLERALPSLTVGLVSSPAEVESRLAGQ